MTLSSSYVSVVIPAFQAEAFVDDAIRSVLDQDAPPGELVVVDDGSTDGTAERLAAWGDRIAVVRQANHGLGRSRNVGVAATSGRLLAFLDADDLWLPDKLARQVEHLEAHPDDLAVFGWMQNFVQPGSGIEPDPRTPLDPRPAYQAPTMLARREVMDVVGPFDEVGPMQGWTDWYLRLKESGRSLGMVDALVLRRRIHGANMTMRAENVMGEYQRLIRASLQRRRAQAAEGP